ncbi:hypothetical protein [Fodinicurvata sediminis]|uniref:hypothetical protein n=1 Tax=Fodinicurvata sediminis TaxID=1121832 RepID=UPI0003B55258|nr:hypothetical protein [Fodinicurvata sediminis]
MKTLLNYDYDQASGELLPEHAACIYPESLHEAYPTYGALPKGCGLLPVPDDRMEPILYQGDQAVIDYMDRSFVSGEIFLLVSRHAPKLWEVRQVPEDRARNIGGTGPYVTMHAFNRPRSEREFHAWRASGKMLRTADGPLGLEHWQEYCIGRLLGRYQPPREAAMYGWKLPGAHRQ